MRLLRVIFGTAGASTLAFALDLTTPVVIGICLLVFAVMPDDDQSHI